MSHSRHKIEFVEFKDSSEEIKINKLISIFNKYLIGFVFMSIVMLYFFYIYIETEKIYASIAGIIFIILFYFILLFVQAKSKIKNVKGYYKSYEFLLNPYKKK